MSITQWLDMDSSHEVGECSVTVVCPLAGVHSDRPCHEIILVVIIVLIVLVVLVVLVEQLNFLYVILLLGEGVAPCASRLGNMLTFTQNGALA